jgi:hypothetical protein
VAQRCGEQIYLMISLGLNLMACPVLDGLKMFEENAQTINTRGQSHFDGSPVQ